MIRSRSLVAAALLAGVPAAWAAGDEHREHAAHEHGHGILEVVADGDALVVELRVPAVNVVGFEHEPSTDAQRHAIEEALTVFRRGQDLLVPSEGARCRVEKVSIALAGLEHHVGEGESGKSSQGDDHERDDMEGHGHETHASHGENETHGKEEPGEETHSELHAAYHFHCDSPAELRRLQVRVFEHLSDAEEIEARVVTPTVQTATELTPGRSVLELAR